MYTFPYDNLVFVSEDEARAYLLPPNSRRLLMDKDRSVFYIKSTDALGQSTMDAYEFTKITTPPRNATLDSTGSTGSAPDAQYITREEFEAFKASITATPPSAQPATPAQEVTKNESTAQ